MPFADHVMGTTREIWTRKLIYPGHTLPTAVAPALVAVGLAWRNEVFSIVPAALALVCGWLIQFAGVVTDNYENLMREPNDREHADLVRAIGDGLVTLRGLRRTALASYGLALAAGFWLALVAGWPVVAIGLISITASWAYSAGPWPVGRHGFANPLFFLFFGIVSVVGTYYVQAAWTLQPVARSEGFSWTAVAMGVPIGALCTNILIIDDVRDRAFDAVKGKRTVAVRFGLRWSRLEYLGWLAVAYLLPVWFWLGLGLGATALLPLVTIPPALALARQVQTREAFADLVPLTPRAAQLVLIYALLLGVGVAV